MLKDTYKAISLSRVKMSWVTDDLQRNSGQFFFNSPLFLGCRFLGLHYKVMRVHYGISWILIYVPLDHQGCQNHCTILIHVPEISNSPKAKMAPTQINKNFGFLSSSQFGPVFICYLDSLPVLSGREFLIFHIFFF